MGFLFHYISLNRHNLDPTILSIALINFMFFRLRYFTEIKLIVLLKIYADRNKFLEIIKSLELYLFYTEKINIFFGLLQE